eukprot:15431049-Alexandrium_andersonii.AAC.1
MLLLCQLQEPWYTKKFEKQLEKYKALANAKILSLNKLMAVSENLGIAAFKNKKYAAIKDDVSTFMEKAKDSESDLSKAKKMMG